MSLKVMSWAWTIALAPTPKLVLMALADEADDRGFCFPSQRRIAEKCNITERSVRRMIGVLASKQYLSVVQRFYKRARTSNGYQLAIDHSRTNCPGVPDTAIRGDRTVVSGGIGHGCPGAPDNAVRVTTTYPVFNPTPLLQHGRDTTPADLRLRSRGNDLCFPKALSTAQRQILAQQLIGLSIESAQQVLDELAGRMDATGVRNPVAYCAKLVERHKRGEFQLEVGIAVARKRQAEQRDGRTMSERPIATHTSADAALDRLPESIRLSLERMRPKSPGEQDHEVPDKCQ
jgi:hypothetical protein